MQIVKSSGYSGFVKLLLFSFAMTIFLVSVAFVLSNIHPKDQSVIANIAARNVQLVLQEPWKLNNYPNEIRQIRGVCNDKQENVEFNQIESISFLSPLPEGTTIKLSAIERVILMQVEIPGDFKKPCEKTRDSDVQITKIADVQITKIAPDDDVFGGEILYLNFGQQMVFEWDFNEEVAIEKEIAYLLQTILLQLEGQGLDLAFPSTTIKSIKFPYGKGPISEGNQENNHFKLTSILSGVIHFPSFPNRRVELKDGDPIDIDLKHGVIRKIKVLPNAFEIDLIAKVVSVRSFGFTFESEAEKKRNVQYLSPTALDIVSQSKLFIIFLSIIGFITSLVGILELLEMKDLFRRALHRSIKKKRIRIVPK